MKKIAIIGSGPAGLTAAYEISKNSNFSCTVFEKSSYVGGMARSFNLFDQIVDIGPHRFFSNDPRVNKIWLEVVGNEYKMVDRTTRIFYKNKFFHYPLKPVNALSNLGVLSTFLCISSYFYYKLFPIKDVDTFEAWVTNRFGKKLYDIFFKSYTEKLWGIPCDKLTSDFAKQRIKKFSLGEAILSSLKFNRKKHKTLVDQFAYPLKGNGYVYEKMKDRVLENNGEILFATNILSIELTDENKYIIDYGNTKLEFDYLISSMPIDNFFKLFNKSTKQLLDSIDKLTFRNTIVVYVKIKQENLFIDQWLYVQDKNILSGRITNFNNWIPEIVNHNSGTLLALEYWCFDNDKIWNCQMDEIRKTVTNDLLNCSFIKQGEDIVGVEVVKVPKCYPVYKEDFKEHLDSIIQFSKSIPNLQLIGRYGSFKYNNQDHSILMGYLAARNILLNETNDIWEINTDYEYHESSTITATGLV